MTLQIDGPATAGHDDLLARQDAVVLAHDLPGAADHPVLQAIARTARRVTGASLAAIAVLGAELQFTLVITDRPALHGERSTSLSSIVLGITRGVFHSADLAADPRFAGHPLVDGRVERLRRFAMVPLELDGVPIGGLSVADLEPGAFDPARLVGLDDLARLVEEFLGSRRTRAQLEETRSDLVDVHRTLVEAQAFDQAMLDGLPVGVVAVGPTGEVVRFNRQSMLWHGRVGIAASLSDDDLAARYRFFRPDGTTPLPTGELPLVRALTTGSAVRSELVMHPTGQVPLLVDCASTPVHLPDGTLIGAVLSMENITERRAMEERLRTAALHDGLTGLPNRSLLADRLAHALRAATRTGTPVAVLYCDLDGFKAVNDGFGHAAGDEVLVEAAARLTRALRPGDTVARIGGDEFVLMCPGVVCPDDARTIADRVTAAMDTPVATSAGAQVVGVSVGFVLSAHDSTPETLLTAADEVMYAVKRRRKGAAARR